ncbi:hypothetical protein [Amycolatopsis aidingensis]|uniref:hypothetical protein n=1 Tax=Amycolatopsis aidingensis TaxID=2842453 RepID=UPI001C0C2CDA|nr:hypothetical protein [Amycolatopsis aidingensis]
MGKRHRTNQPRRSLPGPARPPLRPHPSGDLALGPGSDLGTLLDALRLFGTPPHRIQALLDLVTQNARSDSSTLLSPATHFGITAVQRGSCPLDHDLLGQLQRSVTAITRQVGSTPFVRLQLQLAPIVESCRRLLQRDHPGQHDELARLATHTYALAARLAFETRDDQLATALYTDATAVAGQLKDRNHRATVRTSHTMVTLHATNDLDTARTIAHAATIDAHQGSSYAVRARAHAVHAEICARAGQTREAGAALDRAWRTVEQLTSDDPHSGFNADRLHGFDGLCALHAGDANRAHDSLAHSLNALKTSRDAVQRGIVSTDLALARLRLGDPACADLLHKAIDITATTGGRVPAQRIRLARQHLRPWRTEHFLTELDDHIHDSLIGR